MTNRTVLTSVFAWICVMLTLLTFVVPAHAQEDEDRNYEASASIGYVGTTGNTENQTFETTLLYTLSLEQWVHALEFKGLYAEQESVTNAERYFLSGKSDYRVGEDHYVFGKATYTDDRFTGFDYQATISTGYGHYFLNSDERLLEAYIGLGYRQNALRFGDNEDEAIVTLGERLDWDLTDTTSITQSLTSEVGEERTISRFEIGLVSNIIGRIATKLGFEARHTSKVPLGTEDTDTMTSVSLVYEF